MRSIVTELRFTWLQLAIHRYLKYLDEILKLYFYNFERKNQESQAGRTFFHGIQKNNFRIQWSFNQHSYSVHTKGKNNIMPWLWLFWFLVSARNKAHSNNLSGTETKVLNKWYSWSMLLRLWFEHLPKIPHNLSQRLNHPILLFLRKIYTKLEKYPQWIWFCQMSILLSTVLRNFFFSFVVRDCIPLQLLYNVLF